MEYKNLFEDETEEYTILKIDCKFTKEPIENCIILLKSLTKHYSKEEILIVLKNIIQGKTNIGYNKLEHYLSLFIKTYGINNMNYALRNYYLNENIDQYKQKEEEINELPEEIKNNEKKEITTKRRSTEKNEEKEEENLNDNNNDKIINPNIDTKIIPLDEEKNNNEDNKGENENEIINYGSENRIKRQEKYAKKKFEEKEYIKNNLGKDASISLHFIKDLENSNRIYSYSKIKFRTFDNIFNFKCSTKKCQGKAQYDLENKIFSIIQNHTLNSEEHYPPQTKYKKFIDELKNKTNIKGIQLFNDNSIYDDEIVNYN